MFPSPTTRPISSSSVDPIDQALDAYNAAFEALDLGWHWDRSVLDDLGTIPGERERICAFLRSHRPHLLKVYDEAFLADLILDTKARLQNGGSVRLDS